MINCFQPPCSISTNLRRRYHLEVSRLFHRRRRQAPLVAAARALHLPRAMVARHLGPFASHRQLAARAGGGGGRRRREAGRSVPPAVLAGPWLGRASQNSPKMFFYAYINPRFYGQMLPCDVLSDDFCRPKLWVSAVAGGCPDLDSGALKFAVSTWSSLPSEDLVRVGAVDAATAGGTAAGAYTSPLLSST